MAAGRHNLTRRALLGAGVGTCVALPAGVGALPPDSDPTPFALSLSKGFPSLLSEEEKEGLRHAQPERDKRDRDHEGSAAARRWVRALAAYRRTEARVAAFKAAEALLPAARRAFPCEDLEAAFAQVDSLRLAALRRLLRTPAPDLPALALKLELALADSAWETSGCEDCFTLAAADARRLAQGG